MTSPTLHYTVPLDAADTRRAYLTLPVDLRPEEADRLGAYLAALALPEEAGQ